jgi:hypothetical protein
VFAALQHFVKHQRRGLTNEFAASVDTPGAEFVQPIAFLLSQVGMLPWASIGVCMARLIPVSLLIDFSFP